MENIQINGQKILGPPKDWTGPVPGRGTEIYVKNLPDDVSEFELFRLFSGGGRRIYEIRLPVRWNGSNRGYAFVRYGETGQADSAIGDFHGIEMRPGRRIRVERSVDNCRLFLSSVPVSRTAERIREDLSGVVENVARVYVYPAPDNPDLFRGYAFVEFASHRDAAVAKRILTPDVCLDLFGTKCVAAWANPLPFLDEKVLKTINVLFMRKIPMEVKGITIKKAIENLLKDNTIQKVKRINNFAFLTFKNHESAKSALEIIASQPDFLGGENIQIEWAVPRELTRTNDGHSSQDPFRNERSNPPFHKSDGDFYPIKSQAVHSTDQIGIDSDILHSSNMTDVQKRSKSMKKMISGLKNQFPMDFQRSGRFENRFQPTSSSPSSPNGTEEAAEEEEEEASALWRNRLMAHSGNGLNRPRGNGSCRFPFPVSADTSEATWNLNSDSDFGSDELLPSPRQLKPPKLVSTVKSPAHWNHEEIRSPLAGLFEFCNSPDRFKFADGESIRKMLS